MRSRGAKFKGSVSGGFSLANRPADSSTTVLKRRSTVVYRPRAESVVAQVMEVDVVSGLQVVEGSAHVHGPSQVSHTIRVDR